MSGFGKNMLTTMHRVYNELVCANTQGLVPACPAYLLIASLLVVQAGIDSAFLGNFCVLEKSCICFGLQKDSGIACVYWPINYQYAYT